MKMIFRVTVGIVPSSRNSLDGAGQSGSWSTDCGWSKMGQIGWDLSIWTVWRKAWSVSWARNCDGSGRRWDFDRIV